MFRWSQIAIVLFINWAKLLNASVSYRNSRTWTPERDPIIFKIPENDHDIPLEYIDVFTKIGNKSALIVEPDTLVKAAFVVGAKYKRDIDTLYDSFIDIYMRFTEYPKKLKSPVKITLTLLTQKGEADVVLEFHDTYRQKYGFMETKDLKLYAGQDYSFRINKNGQIIMNNKETSKTVFHLPFEYGYRFVSLFDTEEQLIPFTVSHTFQKRIVFTSELSRIALPFQDYWHQRLPGAQNKPVTYESDSESEEKKKAEEVETEVSSYGVASAGLSDWYYVIIITVVFSVFMVALGVIVFVKKRLKDKQQKKNAKPTSSTT